MPTENTNTDRMQLDRLMAQYGSRLLRMCALYLKDAALAQDAVQDTFLKAYRRMDDFRGDALESTWLTAIAVNVCRDYLRTAWFRHIDRQKDIDDLPHCQDGFIFPDSTVLHEVMGLPLKEREAVLLRYYQGMTLKEAAQVLKISESMVRKRLHKAETILHGRLKEWYDEK